MVIMVFGVVIMFFSGFFWTSLEQISTKNEDLMGIFGSKIGLAA